MAKWRGPSGQHNRFSWRLPPLKDLPPRMRMEQAGRRLRGFFANYRLRKAIAGRISNKRRVKHRSYVRTVKSFGRKLPRGLAGYISNFGSGKFPVKIY